MGQYVTSTVLKATSSMEQAGCSANLVATGLLRCLVVKVLVVLSQARHFGWHVTSCYMFVPHFSEWCFKSCSTALESYGVFVIFALYKIPDLWASKPSWVVLSCKCNSTWIGKNHSKCGTAAQTGGAWGGSRMEGMCMPTYPWDNLAPAMQSPSLLKGATAKEKLSPSTTQSFRETIPSDCC